MDFRPGDIVQIFTPKYRGRCGRIAKIGHKWVHVATLDRKTPVKVKPNKVRFPRPANEKERRTLPIEEVDRDGSVYTHDQRALPGLR